MKAVNATRRKAPRRRRGGKQAEARPSHAIRSSAIPNDAVSNCSTLRSIPTIFRIGLGEGLRGWIFPGMDIVFGLCFHAPVTKDYGAGRRRGGFLGRAFLVLFVLLLLYLFLPFGSQRAVLLGSDARANEVSRSDTIMIAKAGGGLLAVPRDTLVETPGVGQDKMNTAFANGGPELTVETLENFTGLPIGNYVVLNFGGVEEIVDALGSITLKVEEPIETEQDG